MQTKEKKEKMKEEICECGHERINHEGLFKTCLIQVCSCKKFKPQNHSPEGVTDSFTESSPSQTSGSGKEESLSDKREDFNPIIEDKGFWFYKEKDVKSAVKKLKEIGNCGKSNTIFILTKEEIDKIFGSALI